MTTYSMILSSFVLCSLVIPFAVPAVTNDYENRSRNQWQSHNGTCAASDSKCNTESDLAGFADVPPNTPSKTDLIRRSPQDGSGLCVLPAYPEHGGYYVVGRPDAAPGQAFDVLRLNVTCRSGYRAIGKTIVFCINAIWSAEMPQCVRSCKLEKHPSVTYHCVLSVSNYGESYRECNDFEPVGTVIKPECNTPHYYNTGVLSRMHCIGSRWNYIAVCTPECGRITSAGKQLIVGGKEAERGEFPWHAGIYRKTATSYEQICGGSLVSSSIVITAAHCFWDGLHKKVLPESKFAVAVGKLYRCWDHPHDSDAQKSDVNNIRIPFRFKGAAARFQDDIALVILKTPVVYRTYVLPVCIDFDELFERRQLHEGTMGKVAGWGLAAVNGPPSDILKVADMPYIPILKCLEEAPASFEAYITSDKICAGYLKMGTAVCKGDSGGGLVFPDVERGTRRYYLRGIVSTAPNNEDACNAFATSTYTQISAHRSFIEENTVLYGDQTTTLNEQDESDPNPFPFDLGVTSPLEIDKSKICEVPPHPENGIYLFTGTPTSYSIQLTTACNSDFSPDDNSTIYCSNGRWNRKLPVCLSTCNADIGHPTVVYDCEDWYRYCSGVECVETGEILPPMTCVNGVWDSFPACTPECGRVKQGQDKGDGLFPWHVHVYRKPDCPSCRYTRICGGSLINDTLVVTAAHCFWDELAQKPLPASQFAVVVGTQQLEWNASDEPDAQKSDVSRIHIKNLYQGNATGFSYDMAILVLSTAVAYNDRVGPVCVDHNSDFEGLQVRPNRLAKAIGLSSATSTPPALKIIDVKFLETVKCKQQSPAKLNRYLTVDKNCVRYRNSTNDSDVCNGDSGSGIVFPESDRESQRYYLRGVVSTAPSSTGVDDCDPFPFLTFTRIVRHQHFVENIQNVTALAKLV